MKKSFLFIQTKSPLEAGPEAFDLALTAAAFDHEVQLVLAEDGVFWQRTGLPELVSEAVEQIVWERESLTDRGLTASAEITREELTMLISTSDVVVTG
jgi:sulfur relay (sulfurtransferase) DsrF/TusC family protein